MTFVHNPVQLKYTIQLLKSGLFDFKKLRVYRVYSETKGKGVYMTTTLSISEAREQLPSLVDKISRYLNRAVITVRGKPKAILLSPEELDSLEETAEVLAIPGARESILKGAEEAKREKGIPLEEILKQLK